MKKLVIKMDREKIRTDGIYNADKIENYIDSLFEKEGLIKVNEGLYVEAGSYSDYEKFWAIIMYLKNLKWFCDYVAEFVWYNSDDSKDPENFYVEDVKAEMLKWKTKAKYSKMYMEQNGFSHSIVEEELEL